MTMMRWFLAIVALLALFTTVDGQGNARVTRESILEQNEKRKGQLNVMLFETKGKLADHKAGRNLLEDEEKAKLEKRVEMIERKLEKLEEVDEQEIQRAIHREQLRLERRQRPEEL